MKVLFTTNIPSPYRIDFFNELSKYCDLTVTIERKNAENRNSEWLKEKDIQFNIKYLKGIKIGNESAFCPEIVQYLKKNKFDIIVIGGYSTPTGMLAISYLRKNKIKFLLNSDGGIIKKDNIIKYKIKKHFISSASKCLSTGENTNEYLKYYGINKENIYIYPFSSIRDNEILDRTLNDNEKENLKQELNISEKNVIISIGQFIPRKGFDVLINAVPYVKKNTGIYIIGGKVPDEYVKLKEKLNANNIHFVDFKPKMELIKYYKVADIFAFPTREDIWGLVINEAMAYGLPIVTTDKCVAGLELVKNEENGYIVSINDSKELANKINIILQDDLLRRKMSVNNIKKIKGYTIEKMALRHIDIFNQIRKEETNENR